MKFYLFIYTVIWKYWNQILIYIFFQIQIRLRIFDI